MPLYLSSTCKYFKYYSNKKVIFKNSKIRSEPLSNYHIWILNEINNKSKQERFEKLLSELKLEILDSAARHSILNICKDKEFSDCFHLASDKFTCDNFYEQNIQLGKTYKWPRLKAFRWRHYRTFSKSF